MDKEGQKKIIADSYQNLSDIIVEGIKGLSAEREELMQRNRFTNPELAHTFLQKNQSILVACGHIGNWEWGVLNYGFHFGKRAIGIHKSITNKDVEKVVTSLRSVSGLQLISTKETRVITEQLPEGRLIIMMADQNPSDINNAIWVNFFNQPTACLHGISKYAKNHCLPILFADTERIKRGWYTTTFSILIADPSEFTETEICQLYMSKIESCIRRNPGDWLWTHKRWKHTKLD